MALGCGLSAKRKRSSAEGGGAREPGESQECRASDLSHFPRINHMALRCPTVAMMFCVTQRRYPQIGTCSPPPLVFCLLSILSPLTCSSGPASSIPAGGVTTGAVRVSYFHFLLLECTATIRTKHLHRWPQAICRISPRKKTIKNYFGLILGTVLVSF